MFKLTDARLMHIQNGIERPQPQQFRNHGCPYFGCQNLRSLCAQLRRKDAHPYLLRLRPGAPETKKIFKIMRSICNLPRDRAVDSSACALKVLQDAFVRGGLSTCIVFWL